ncbi:hypothetical protein O1V64_12165 [Rouxiella badensis]|nr:hypothetical protein O1V64_12165 [Rouxiella badensis]
MLLVKKNINIAQGEKIMDVIFDFDFTLMPEESTVEVLKLALAADAQRAALMQRLADIAPRVSGRQSEFGGKPLHATNGKENQKKPHQTVC